MTSTDAPGADSSMWGIRIEMPLVPPKQMSHNARGSRWGTTRVSKVHRKRAADYTAAAIEGIEIPKGVHLRYDVEVYWGSGRLRCDDDALPTMNKPILDGLADGLGGTSDRKLHLGTMKQGRDADKKGWMAFTLSIDDRDHSNVVRRMGEAA
jgi:hypothetical protein